MQRDGHKHEDLKKENLLKPCVEHAHHHRAANYLYDHPFVMISSFGFLFASYVLNSQLKLKHRLSPSESCTVVSSHRRVTMAMTTMAFREYMDKRGRFLVIVSSPRCPGLDVEGGEHATASFSISLIDSDQFIYSIVDMTSTIRR